MMLDILFLSTRSCERDPCQRSQGLWHNISIHPLLRAGSSSKKLPGSACISIHPLLRAGSSSRPRTSSYLNFYPPALASGINSIQCRTRHTYFYPPALASGIFLNPQKPHIYNISIHPLLRAGSAV